MSSSFVEVSIGEKVDFGEIVYNDGHYVRAFTMQSHADYGIKVSFQRTEELDISIQTANDNLPHDKDFLDPVRDNYVDDFNYMNQVSELLLAPRERLRLFIALKMPDSKEEKRQQDTHAKRTHKFRNYTGSIKVTCTSASEAKALHSSVITVAARACKSVLMIENSDVMFIDCVPGRTFYKDIDVWNMSEAVARFQIRWAPAPPHVRNAAAELQVYSIDTGDIREEHELQGMQRKMFQLKFSPMRIGHSQGRLELVNAASPLSPASIVVSTFTTSTRTADSDVLVLTSEIDFGNCVTGLSTSRPLRFKNNSGDRVSVLLSSDRPKETTFLLETSEDATSAAPKSDASALGDTIVNVSSGAGPKPISSSTDDTAPSGTESRKKDQSVEEVILQPGQEKSLFVSFCPALDAALSPLVQPRLQSCDFRISFKVSRTGERDSEGESKMESLRPVRCRASVCTSIISVYPTAINMGECLVAMTKVTQVRVTNLSDVPARICMSLKSKHLSILGSVDPVFIPVGGFHEFTLQLQPTTANPDYRKLIWVSNMLNPHNDVTIQVSSSNVDRNRVALHSILYTVSASELFVGKTTASSKMLRSISFRNITVAPIRIALCSEISGTIAIYVPREFARKQFAEGSAAGLNAVSTDAAEACTKPSRVSHGSRPFGSITGLFAGNVPKAKRRSENSRNDEQQLARLQSQLDLATPSTKLGRNKSKSVAAPLKRPVRRRPSTVALDPAVLNEQGGPLGCALDEKLMACSRLEADGFQDASTAAFDLAHLLSIFDNYHPSVDPPFFKSCDQERGFVLDKLELLRKCEALLTSSCVHVDDVVLPPGVEVPVILGISAENCGVDIGGKLVAVEMAVLVQLLEFDQDLLKRAQEEIETLDKNLDMLPQRRIPIHIQQVCVSSMDVSQTHLNFGLIETGSDPKYLKINLTNCAEVPLLYQIQMSGRFASGSISFRNHGEIGVVRPFLTKVIEICVDPKIRGTFSETMLLQNVLNPSDTIPITVKAEVKLRETFSLNASDSIDFGSVIVDSLSNEASITVTNLTSASRMFTMRQLQHGSSAVDSDSPLFNVHFTVQLGKQIGALRQKLTIEEKIEKLEHKLRIAQRKQKAARVTKIISQIDAYRMELSGNIPTKVFATSSFAQDETPPSSDLSDADSMSGSDSESDSESSMSIIKKKSMPFFSTEKPYTFEIEGRCSRNIHIRICGTRMAGGVSKPFPEGFEEFVQGTIVIHETKNSEVDKRINFSAVLVHAARSFEDANFPFNHSSLFPSGNRSSALVVEQSSCRESKRASVGCQISTVFLLRNPTAHTCSFRLSLRSSSVLSGEIKNVKCNSSNVPWQGEVNPMGRREVALTVEPQREGRLDVVFTVQDLTNGGSLALTWIIHAKADSHLSRIQPILFPGNTNLIVDFGDCYIDPSPNASCSSGIPMKKQKLEIRSLEQRVQVVSIKSNLMTQVAFFKDEALKENAESFILRAHETITCYVALAQPSHPFVYGEASNRSKSTKSTLAKQLMDEYKSGRCRVLNGGITVTARFADDAQRQSDSSLKHEVSLKLTANIGMSIMKIVHPTDSLCFVPTIPYFDSVHRFQEHNFSVLNETESLPMRYSITNPHKSDGITVSKATNDLAPKKQYTHTLKIEQRLGGLSISVIEVSNSSSRQVEFVRITSISISNPPALEFLDLPMSLSKLASYGHSAVAGLPPSSPGGFNAKKVHISRLLDIPPFYSRTDVFDCSSEHGPSLGAPDVELCVFESDTSSSGLVFADSLQGLIVSASSNKNLSAVNRPADVTVPEILSPLASTLVPGDVIVKIDGFVVRSILHAKDFLQSKLHFSSMAVQLLISRDQKPLKISFPRQKFAALLDASESYSEGNFPASVSFDLLWFRLMWKHAPHSVVTLHLKERYAIEERLVAVSKLPIIVSNYPHLDDSLLYESFVSSLNNGLPYIDQLSNAHDMFSSVGLRCNCPNPIIIPPYAAEIQLRITPVSSSYHPSQYEGLLLFLRPESLNRSNLKVHASIAGALYAKGSFVDHSVVVNPERIDVGRIGFNNGWSDAPFHFTLGTVTSAVSSLVAMPRRLWGVTDACVLSRTGISPRTVDSDTWNIMCAYKGQVEKLLSGTCVDDWFVIDVPAGQIVNISGHLRPSVYKEEGYMGRVSYRIPAFGVFTNTASELCIHALIVDVPWITQRLEQSSGVLKLPPLYIPVAPDAGPCDCWFVVKNQRDSPVTINFRTVIMPHFLELVVFSMLLRSNDTLCESVTLQPGSSVELRLRLRAAKKTLPHNKWPKAALSSCAYKLCDIEMTSSEYNETLHVHGQLLCAPTLSVMDTEVSLSFNRDERNSRHVRAREKIIVRCMREDDVSFRICLESRSTSMEQLLQRIVLQPESGVIKSGDMCEVWLEISAHRNLFQDLEDRISSIGTIVITDPDSCETCLRVDLRCMLPDELLSDNDSDDASAGIGGGSSRVTETDIHSVSELGAAEFEDVGSCVQDGREDREDSNCYVKLRNCTEIDAGLRYQVNVGQVEMGSESQKWKIFLESNSAEPILWEIFQAGPISGWIRLSKTSGSLKNAEDSDSITLTLVAQDIGAYSTYLCFVNKTNPLDFKTVKVLAEVVSPKPARDASQSQNLFRIDMDGLLQPWNSGAVDNVQRVVHIGDVCYGQRLDAKSFHLVNLSSTLALEFVLSHSTLQDSSDILFALAETSSEMVRTVFVKPSESLRIFAFLRPRPPVGDPPTTVANLRVVAEIKCRLIRDHVEEIVFIGRARSPQFVLVPPIPSKIGFSVRSQSIFNVQMERSSASQFVELEPPFIPWNCSISLPYESSLLLYNPSKIFKVELLKKLSPDLTIETFEDALEIQRLGSSICCVKVGEPSFSGDDKALLPLLERPRTSIFISVLPSVSSILQPETWKLLMQQRYIEETAFLYNAADLTEYHVLRIGLSLRDDQTVIPSARNSLAINSLEARVVNVLRDFCLIASEYSIKLASISGCPGGTQAMALVSHGSSSALSAMVFDEEKIASIHIPLASAHAMHVHCLVDELMVLSKKGLHGGIARELAVLLFCGLFSSELAPCFADFSKIKFYPPWLSSYVRQLEWFISAFSESLIDENLDVLRTILNRSISRITPDTCSRQQSHFVDVM